MEIGSLPLPSLATLLLDCIRRDVVTARRTALLQILLHERYLTLLQLRERVEDMLGKGCFGVSAWEDAFYRDMCVVKAALKAAGYQLAYSRSPHLAGYYLRGQARLSPELAEEIRLSVAEVDPLQVEIWRRLTPAERFRLACSITDAAHDAVVYRTRQRHPELTPVQAAFLALQGRLP